MLTKKKSKTAGVSWCELCRRFYNASGVDGVADEYIPTPAEEVEIDVSTCQICFTEGALIIVELAKASQRNGHSEVYTEEEINAFIVTAFSQVQMKNDARHRTLGNRILSAKDGTPLTRAQRRRRK